MDLVLNSDDDNVYALELLMVGSPTCRVDQATGDTRYKELVINLELNDTIKFLFTSLKHAVKLLSLWNGSRESI